MQVYCLAGNLSACLSVDPASGSRYVDHRHSRRLHHVLDVLARCGVAIWARRTRHFMW